MSIPVNFYDLTSEQLSDNAKLHASDAHRAIAIAKGADPSNAANMLMGAAGAVQMADSMADLLRHRADRAGLLASQAELLAGAAGKAIKEAIDPLTGLSGESGGSDDDGPGLRSV